MSTASTTWMTPFVAAMLAATMLGVVVPLVVVMFPVASTRNDWPSSVLIVLLWPATLGRTLFEKCRPFWTWYSRIAVSVALGSVHTFVALRPSAAKAAFVGAKTVSCCPLVSAAATAGSAQPTAA